MASPDMFGDSSIDIGDTSGEKISDMDDDSKWSHEENNNEDPEGNPLQFTLIVSFPFCGRMTCYLLAVVPKPKGGVHLTGDLSRLSKVHAYSTHSKQYSKVHPVS